MWKLHKKNITIFYPRYKVEQFKKIYETVDYLLFLKSKSDEHKNFSVKRQKDVTVLNAVWFVIRDRFFPKLIKSHRWPPLRAYDVRAQNTFGLPFCSAISV